jgi:hypothetical protein
VHVNHIALQAEGVYVEAMSDELKSVRVQLLMTPTEVAAIDDWSFQSRIRSRGEAIRQLIQAGIKATTGQPSSIGDKEEGTAPDVLLGRANQE